MNKLVYWVGVPVLVAVAIAGYWLWRDRQPQATPPEAPAVAAAPAPEVAASAVEPAIKYPIEAPQAEGADAAPATAAGPDDPVVAALTELLGRPAVRAHLQLDGFVQHLVATVDNLGRSHAPPRLWPGQPTPGRFAHEQGTGGAFIGAANHARYTPFVGWVESIDSARAVALYVRFYPLFQRAYVELGYPRGYFNDRLVEVIDQLLATPEPAEPPTIELTEVKGSAAPTRPWLLYEFSDPSIRALSAGQKILLRMGVANERRLKAKLVELRSQLTSKATRR